MERSKTMTKTALILISCVLLTNLVAAEDKQKIIFDCDLGDDIDDAFALAMVLASPEFEILGLVMDYGNTAERAKIAARILYETGQDDIPIFVGRKSREHYSRQFYWGQGQQRILPKQQSAADFIVESLRKYPNEVILFTVGPVPNMLDVIHKDSEALKLAKGIYSMFGSFYMGYNTGPIPDPEWNVRADEEAAKAFAASGAKITYAGLDVTTYIKLEQDQRLRLLMRQSPLTNALSGLYSLWARDDRETPVLFDCVAVGMVLWPDLFKTRPAHVKVIDGGYTIIDESQPPNSQVGIWINQEEFLRRLMDRYLTQNLRRKD
jgi:inosine-uridine nucleoside N-ribohydrolase